MQKFSEEFILVPRASVSARASEPETRSAAVVAASTSSFTTAPAVVTTSTAETKVQQVRTSLPLGRSFLSKLPLKGDHAVTTTICAYYEDAVISSVALDYKTNLYCDLAAEFASFAALFEQYKCTSIRLETWTGNICPMNNTIGNLVAGPLVEMVTPSPYLTAPTLQRILDAPNAHFLDFGYSRNHFVYTYKPHGCYVPDTGASPDNFIHSGGWQETSCVAKHIWGCWLQQSSATVPLTTASGHYIPRRLTFTVQFRRRRQT
jgi:hypothetical protein